MLDITVNNSILKRPVERLLWRKYAHWRYTCGLSLQKAKELLNQEDLNIYEYCFKKDATEIFTSNK